MMAEGEIPIAAPINTGEIPTAEPINVGEYQAGTDIILPEGVQPGTQLVIETPQGSFMVMAPPNAYPGMHLMVPPMNISAPPQPVVYDDIPAEVGSKYHEKCNIIVVLDRQPPYRLGETITGRVTIEAKEQFKVKKVTFKMECQCYARWEEQEWESDGDGGGRSVRRTKRRSREITPYKVHLFEGSYLEEGVHEYPFTMTLPNDAPPTLQGGWARDHVRYSSSWRAIVNVDRPWAFDVTMKREFDVNGCTPDPTMLQPYISTQDLPVSVCCYSFGNIHLEMSFGESRAFQHTAGGFVTGLLAIKATNASSKSVTRMEFELLERITVFNHQRDSNTYGKFGDGSLAIPPRSDDGEATTVEKVMVVRFPLPRQPTSYSHIFEVSHAIEVSMDIDWCPDPSFKIPLVIC